MNPIEILKVLLDYVIHGQEIPAEALTYTFFCAIALVCVTAIGFGFVLLVIGGYRKPDPQPTGNPEQDDWRNWR